MSAILRAIGAGGQVAEKLADIICRLVVHGAELGELEEYEIPDPDQPKPAPGEKPATKTCRTIPRGWLDRLTTAIERGAIDRISTERIVEILLQGQR
jgi:hypothetical protein